MLNVFDRMENIVWKGEYAGMQNFLISHNIVVKTLILHYFAWETNSLTALINPTRFCFMQTTGKSLLAPNVCTSELSQSWELFQGSNKHGTL